MKLFNYKLKPIEKCAVEKERYCWYFLSDSNFYFQFGNEKIFEYSVDFAAKYPKAFTDSMYADYYFDQVFSDLLIIGKETLPSIPQHIYKYIDTVDKFDLLREKYSENRFEKWQDVDDIHNDYLFKNLFLDGLYTGYFCKSPTIQFFHVEDKILIRYDSTQLFNLSGFNSPPLAALTA